MDPKNIDEVGEAQQWTEEEIAEAEAEMQKAGQSILLGCASANVRLDIAQMIRNADDAIANMEDRS